jgi:hypothetical protein
MVIKIGNEIKIIENNYTEGNLHSNKKYDNPIQITCDNCGSKLEITKNNTYIGWLGARHVKCPCCGEPTMVDEIDGMDGIKLTVDNINFPIHFLHTNKNMRKVKEVYNTEIQEYIKRGVSYLRIHKDEQYWYTSFGDLFLVIIKYDGDEEYYVMVTKDFYDTYIPFENIDYSAI